MTGYTVHTGSTVKFSQGWDRIFPAASGAANAETAANGEKETRPQKAQGKTTKKAAAQRKAKAAPKAAKKKKK